MTAIYADSINIMITAERDGNK